MCIDENVAFDMTRVEEGGNVSTGYDCKRQMTQITRIRNNQIIVICVIRVIRG